MREILAVAVVMTIGCGAPAPMVQYAGIKDSDRVEEKALPDAPNAVPIPEEWNWVVPLPAGRKHTKAGVLLSPEKAARAVDWKNGYNNIRSLYELDRKVWREHRTIYEERLKKANEEIRRLSPTWYEHNKIVIGFVTGVATTVAIVFAINGAQ